MFDATPSMPHDVPVMHSIPPESLTLLSAVRDSISTRQCIMVHVSDVESCIRFLRQKFVDVDWDPFPDRVTIFGDDTSVEGDEDEGRFSIDLMRPVVLTSNPYAVELT